MKRIFYIVAFMILGLLLVQLVHAAIEIPILAFLTRDMERYGESFLWRHWSVLHGAFAWTLALTGLVIGFGLGRKCWRILYIEKRFGTPRW
jgi:hypothetical protein